MQFPLTPHRDEAAALAFDDVASGLDAGLTPVMLGGNADHGERVLQDLLGRRRVELRPIEDQVLAAAWRAGRAGQVLRALARQRRQRAEMARNLIGRLCYPLAVLAMAIVAAAITGSLMVVIVLAVALCSAIAAGMYAVAANHPILLRTPLVGDWARDRAEVPYLQVLHGLYSSGVPLREAHQAAAGAYPMAAERQLLIRANELLQDGQSLAAVFAAAPVLHSETRQLLAMGEESGELEQALDRALDRRSAQANARSQLLVRLVGTAVYVAAAAIAIFVIFSFYGSYLGFMRR